MVYTAIWIQKTDFHKPKLLMKLEESTLGRDIDTQLQKSIITLKENWKTAVSY